MLLQNALSRAHPSGLPSNLVIQQFFSPYDQILLVDDVKMTVQEVGYPYGYGETLHVNAGSGTTTLTINEQSAAAFVFRVSAFSTSPLSVTWNGAALSSVSIAQTIPIARNTQNDVPLAMLGRVGINPWGTPTNWPDTYAVWMGPEADAVSGAPPGEWVIYKWIYVTATQSYTFSLAADQAASLFFDNALILTSSSYSTTAQYTMQVTPGMHFVAIDVQNAGTSHNPTGVLFSMIDPNGHVLEDGANGDLKTTGYVNHPWSFTSGNPIMRDTWYMVQNPTATSGTLALTVPSGGYLAEVHVYSVAPWRWDAGGMYDQTANTTLPITTTTVEVI